MGCDEETALFVQWQFTYPVDNVDSLIPLSTIVWSCTSQKENHCRISDAVRLCNRYPIAFWIILSWEIERAEDNCMKWIINIGGRNWAHWNATVCMSCDSKTYCLQEKLLCLLIAQSKWTCMGNDKNEYRVDMEMNPIILGKMEYFRVWMARSMCRICWHLHEVNPVPATAKTVRIRMRTRSRSQKEEIPTVQVYLLMET